MTDNVLYTMAGIVGLLVVSSLLSLLLKRLKPSSDFTELRQRIRTWWMMVIVFSIAMLLSRYVSIVFFGVISFLALKEFFSMIQARRVDRRAMFWAYLAIPVQYYWIAIGWYGMFIVFIPVYMFLLMPARLVLMGRTDGFLRSVGMLHWGLMTTVFSLSHLAFLLVLPIESNPNAGGAGFVLFVVILTQANDVFQYLWGKSLGHRKVLPSVSPGKTWAGLLGGIASTTALAVGIAIVLTPLSWQHSIIAGLMTSIAGFLGDVSISALKRDLKLKDTGSLLPGHGGILDRVDSLTYTAPLMFHWLVWLLQVDIA